MATIQNPRSDPKGKAASYGLLASGSCGAWEIDIDEALSGADRWWAQIEGPSVSLDFAISSLDIVDQMIRYVAPRSTKTKRPANGSPKRVEPLCLGGTPLMPVSLMKDDEFDDRFIFVIGPTDSLTVRILIASKDVSEFAEALREVKQDLADG